MRARFIFGAIVLGLLSTGCGKVVNASHGTGYWTRQALRDSHERKRNHRMAKEAWDQFQQTNPGSSADFSDGFQDGFADHLFRGTLHPPIVPPNRYRGIAYQSAEGFRAGSEWLQGFEVGIAEAQARGLRQWIVGPTSLVAGIAPEQAPVAAPPAIPIWPAPPTERLPIPRSIEKPETAEPSKVSAVPQTLHIPPIEPPSKFPAVGLRKDEPPAPPARSTATPQIRIESPIVSAANDELALRPPTITPAGFVQRRLGNVPAEIVVDVKWRRAGPPTPVQEPSIWRAVKPDLGKEQP